MKQVRRALALWLLLILGQQGAVVHELSHFYASEAAASSHLEADGAADRACALCPVFAQVSTPAFSHAFHIPALLRAEADRFPELAYLAIEAAVPTPRSRGPPLSS
ncbi:MAG TPA: hypothetical protein VKG05_03450 [Steroidobacteraceae bacterium]|nr:hypothetical protein [Steroidobacteraceae bacterium]